MRTFIPNVESKVCLPSTDRKRQSIYLAESEFTNNSPISFIFNFWSIIDHIIKRYTQEELKIYFWEKFHFVQGILARDIASLWIIIPAQALNNFRGEFLFFAYLSWVIKLKVQTSNYA